MMLNAANLAQSGDIFLDFGSPELYITNMTNLLRIFAIMPTF